MKMILASSTVAALLLATVPAWAGASAQNRAPAQVGAVSTKVATGHAQTAVACNFCFTCGGDWPVFAGQTALGSSPFATERGSGCSGSGFTTGFNDGNPFLCCR